MGRGNLYQWSVLLNLLAIGLMIAASLGVWLFRQHRLNVLLAISVLALYALQPAGAGGLETALPTTTILLVLGVWWLTTPAPSRSDGSTLLLIVAAAVLVPLLRAIIDSSAFRQVILMPPFLAALAVGTVAVGALTRTEDEVARRRLALAFIGLIVLLLVVIKLPPLQHAFTEAWMDATRYSSHPGWQWLGFSYVAFRLMHVLLDYRSGRLKPASLRDFALYVVFYPALTAGPIDRVEHFTRELKQPRALNAEAITSGTARIARGLLKKFVLADSLAYLALSPQLVAQTTGPYRTISTWLMVYAYAFQIYLDFSGYTDVAIGIGLLAGITLPENFTAPYMRRNITAFWNSWHITLSTWFRNYFFTPFSRFLMQTSLRERRLLIILVAQVSTMILIGLWHGIALNFVLWGAWHGVGLWLNRWLVDQTRGWNDYVQSRPRLAQTMNILSILATFHFVAVGWIFFALADLNLIGKALAGLVGLGG
jgi:D-alanyl-lipoteichoic acid acyltransferase DltB (MBOAT superfamily)